MKQNWIIPLIAATLLMVGCDNNKTEILSTSELARGLNLIVAQLELPKESQENREQYFILHETSEGRDSWGTAFRSPQPGGTVKLLGDPYSKLLTILLNDGSSRKLGLMENKMYECNDGWPVGHIQVGHYVVIYADSQEGLLAAQPNFASFYDEEQQRKAEASKWYRISFVAASDVPEDAPDYVHQVIQQLIQHSNQN
ncbi:hypothetical protein SH580_03955 [Coraliomargarita algicola]|uniref:Lipoprotein n=1 Tax=Coraliomargarita algicola TaxID=3092156 RepID=A0ABZ0RV66_9BACT|nr:hypothetical protein [Coraliomargarita sp. J2-16]WPJ96859.1 hypothetical protein SH580_03955 [Coraliomargarita sp. J2-16]